MSAVPPSTSFLTRTPTTPRIPPLSISSHKKLKTNLSLNLCRQTLRCSVSSGPGGPTSGDNESRTVLDAFFLGKALAESLNERIESAVGEFLSTVSRLQAEQQRQIQDFQADVLERAKKAKEQAAREAMGVQGIVPKPTTVNGTSSVSDGNISVKSPSAVGAVDAPNSSPYTIANSVTETDSDTADKDTL